MPQKAIPSTTLAAAVREYLGLSQVQLAVYLGLTRGQIAHVEAGRRLLRGEASQRLRELAQLLPDTDHSAEPSVVQALPAVPAPVRLRRRQVQCARRAASLRVELTQLEACAAQARRWEQLLVKWRAGQPSQSAEAHTARQHRFLEEWAATAAAALNPDAMAERVLLKLRIKYLEAEAAALREILAVQVTDEKNLEAENMR
ncbi:helix-turn-helix domain-containing protein [Hymenobacter weizhouensis]|uniref:helix-turn-helix domain-containing protein n=1 Tax=Hymenobacter sp. YIM 151500-1 TaxID=2987689 RepID=UPI0039B6EBDF